MSVGTLDAGETGIHSDWKQRYLLFKIQLWLFLSAPRLDRCHGGLKSVLLRRRLGDRCHVGRLSETTTARSQAVLPFHGRREKYALLLEELLHAQVKFVIKFFQAWPLSLSELVCTVLASLYTLIFLECQLINERWSTRSRGCEVFAWGLEALQRAWNLGRFAGIDLVC